ncbi:S8 family serine peptidase [Algibacter amylolyticus]|uniref:S8 family serine peptidase n=1 Tax=Algibacter amylolyticus TaxID=1608400 RepID=A0A5M7BDG8_9FLAO|nr:S8 family peptidase [Algibacter amylolyticus]KAA5827469.1 S8 family serine peptidase [Algibacter amylolyticus]MBB5266666.1 subtilisin family serine protease [Algibacter amylolyticus]TSJ81714.1 S8 family serine peptidase [Algibacter amylolyticus]
MKTINLIAKSAFLAVLISGCGGVAPVLSTPVENIDSSPLKVSELTDAEAHNWGHLDLVKDTIPGMSVDKAYAEIIKNKKGKKVIVAVIDSGIDIDHEDLNDVIWTNKDEIPNNGKDDDNNGYVDDVHGWNFLGEGYNEQLEFVRILASGDTSNPDYAAAKAEYDSEYQKWLGRKTQYEQIYQQLQTADAALTKHFGKKDYTKKEVAAIKTENESLAQAQQIANYMLNNGMDSMTDAVKEIENGLESINERLNYNLNKDFKGRVNGDNPDDMSTKFYGNGNVKPVKITESHGTHVAGIIAAERNNGKGANGVANNVEIMSIRAVPNGDEYDKDVALAIRYAVDNGASIINGSFGKSFSTHSDWVRDAITYASEKDVIFVHAAGNDSKDVDTEPNFPDDNVNYNEISNTYIRVGALAPKYGSSMVAGFSNYGKQNVDVFAPGASVYSTTPENDYQTKGGTSMAAPGVAGVAALIRSQYPSLSAAQVKQIIMDSGLAINSKVIVGGNSEDIRPFANLSKSAKMVNAYNALIMAAKLAK